MLFRSVSFVEDCKIVLMTAKKVFFRKNITESNKEIDVTIDYGDELLKNKQVSREEYETMQIKAINLIKEFEEKA